MTSLGSETDQIDKEIADAERVVKQGEKNFVLVPERNYRFYQKQVKENEVLNKYVSGDQCLNASRIEPFFEGAAATVLVSLVVYLLVKP